MDELSLSLDNGRLGGVRSTSFEQNTTSFSSSLNNLTPKKTTEHSGRNKECSRKNNCSITQKKDSFLLALINILEDDIYRLIGEKTVFCFKLEIGVNGKVTVHIIKH